MVNSHVAKSRSSAIWSNWYTNIQIGKCAVLEVLNGSGTIGYNGLASWFQDDDESLAKCTPLSSPPLAADQGQLALALKAQTDFDRVALAAQPQLSDTALCMQSQAAILSVSPPEELALLHYRMGYCQLAAGAITHANRDSLSAAAEFDKAIESWPVSTYKGGKPAAAAGFFRLRVLAWLARTRLDRRCRAGRARLRLPALRVPPASTYPRISAGSCSQQAGSGSAGWQLQNDVDAAAKNSRIGCIRLARLVAAGSSLRMANTARRWPNTAAPSKSGRACGNRPSFLRRLGPKPNPIQLADLAAHNFWRAIRNPPLPVWTPRSGRPFRAGLLPARAPKRWRAWASRRSRITTGEPHGVRQCQNMVSGKPTCIVAFYLSPQGLRGAEDERRAANFEILTTWVGSPYRVILPPWRGFVPSREVWSVHWEISPYFPKPEARAVRFLRASGAPIASNSAK